MKAQDLRIGNIIQHRYIVDKSGVITVSSIHVKPNDTEINIDKNGSYYSIDDMTGLPLTEEWLLRFGFEYRNDSRGNGAIMDLKGEKYKSASVAFSHPPHNENGRFIYMTVWSAPLNYVHQLQNLHYAKTGEELTIKELTT